MCLVISKVFTCECLGHLNILLLNKIIVGGRGREGTEWERGGGGEQGWSRDSGNGQPVTSPTPNPSHGQAQNPDIINDTVILADSPLRGSTQRLAETDAETHSQTVDRGRDTYGEVGGE